MKPLLPPLRWLLPVLLWLLAPVLALAQALPGTTAAGYYHALAIHADGTLWATGGNMYGQLGTGTTTSSTAWVQVGTATSWVQVAAGQYHSLGLRADGTLWAWGNNKFGQLANTTNTGTDNANATPTQVAGTYTQVAAGGFHSLALTASGSLYAWGYNYYGQLGNTTNTGTTNANATPTQVAGTYVQVAAGIFHSLGLRAGGSLYAWGLNQYGQLGNTANAGTGNANATPTQVAGTYTQVAAGGFHGLGLRANGSLYAWGSNQYGQLGNTTNSGTATANATPTVVAGTYTQVAGGYYHSLALQADGTLYAWGGNRYGQLASTTNNGTDTANPAPTQVAGTYVQVAAGLYHTLGLAANGSLAAWGRNDYGQLGTATNSATGNPTPTPTVTGTALVTRSLAMGTNFGLAVRGDGTLWAWGSNAYGQLGIALTTAGTTRPVQVGTATDWVMVAAGQYHSLGLRADGSLYAWGRNDYGQLGSATNSGTLNANPTPTQVAGTYTQVAAGQYHSLALKADGTFYAWGGNRYGQLGSTTNNGTSTANPTPAQVAGTYVQVAAGQLHSLGLRADGTLYAWGYNYYGQLGSTANNSTSTANPTPQLVAGTYVQVAAGQLHSLGLRADGSLYAWGYNRFGQLGTTTNNGNGSPNSAPVRVGTDLYTQVAAGDQHSLGLQATGAIYTWGYDDSGQLGDDNVVSNGPTPTPAQEATGGTGWTTLGTGATATFSLVRTASAQNFASTGYNGSGQLGDGTTTEAHRFDRVSPLASLQPLPVQLVAFTATAAGPAAVQLAWATASEVNSARFDMERSQDGFAYYKVGEVAAAGSTTAHAYSYLDAAAPAGLLYYRLRQVDQDGSAAYSPVRSVTLGGAGLALFPNPSTGTATLSGTAPGAAVQVLDALGRVVATATADAEGTVPVGGGLAPGVYVVRAGGQVLRLAVQ